MSKRSITTANDQEQDDVHISLLEENEKPQREQRIKIPAYRVFSGFVGEDYASKFEANYPLGLRRIIVDIRQRILTIQRGSNLGREINHREDGGYSKLMNFNPPETNFGDISQKIFHIQIHDFPFCVLVKTDPTLRKRNTILLEGFSENLDYSEEDRAKKIVVYASKNARCFGVRPGMIYSEAKIKCSDLLIPKFNINECFKACLNFFKAIMLLTNEVEAGACDEAIVDVTDLVSQGVTRGYNTLEHLVFTIQSLVFDETGFWRDMQHAKPRIGKPCFSSCKTITSPILYPECQSVEELPVFRTTARVLKKRYKVSTCRELLEKGLEQFQKDFGVEMGNRLYSFASGEDGDGLRHTYWKKVNVRTHELESFKQIGIDQVLQNLTRVALAALEVRSLKPVKITMGVTFIRLKEHACNEWASVVLDCLAYEAIEPYSSIVLLWRSTNVKFSETKRLTISFLCTSVSDNGELESEEFTETPFKLASRRKRPALREYPLYPDFLCI